jgi:hypothetical protein
MFCRGSVLDRRAAMFHPQLEAAQYVCIKSTSIAGEGAQDVSFAPFVPLLFEGKAPGDERADCAQ